MLSYPKCQPKKSQKNAPEKEEETGAAGHTAIYYLLSLLMCPHVTQTKVSGISSPTKKLAL